MKQDNRYEVIDRNGLCMRRPSAEIVVAFECFQWQQ